MAEEQLKMPEAESTAVSVAAEKDVTTEEKTVIRYSGKKDDDSEFMVVVEKKPDRVTSKGGPFHIDVALANLEKEKTLCFIKAWEENEKLKAENKSEKRRSTVEAWENSKKADAEAKLKKIKEQLEKKKAEYAEKMKNKVALIHKQAEERRAKIEARCGEKLLKTEETAARYRETGQTPKKTYGRFLIPCFCE